MKARRKIVISVAVMLLVVTVAATSVAVLEFRKLQEFGMAESVKGYWASLQQYRKMYGRYPSDDGEIAAFFHIELRTAPVLYVAPHDDKADEPILWWREKARSGVTVGITEAGQIVKR